MAPLIFVIGPIIALNVIVKGASEVYEAASQPRAPHEIRMIVPPVEVPFGIGYDRQAEQNLKARKDFFRKYEKGPDGRWRLK